MTVRELRALLFKVSNQDATVCVLNWEILGGQRSSASLYQVEAVEESALDCQIVVAYDGEVRP